MRRLSIIDTFPEFERYWESVRAKPVEVQIDVWEHEYMAHWPELREKQLANYAKEGVDWKRVARTRIFPHISERLPRMRRIRRALLRTLPGYLSKTQQTLKLDFPVQFVIYVGIGCGAGWATRYGGRPACLFGLENAAELATGRGRGIPGSVPHEIAHLAHEEWRRKGGLPGLEEVGGPYWQLYTEGFATECERQVLEPAEFRGRTGNPTWLTWCERHRSWLARKFLRDVRDRRSTRPFFGSWYNIRGQVESGYWLGAEIVKGWRRVGSWREIAALPGSVVRRRARLSLLGMARLGAR